MDFAEKFATGQNYGDFLQTYGTDEHRRKWGAMLERITLTPAQTELLGGFRREIRILCLAGTWCGDCVNQCPIFERFAQATPKLIVRYFDRDAHPDLGERLSICGAARVPAVLFLSEDHCQVGLYGDRTLSKYRRMAADQLGAACPTGLVPDESQLISAVVQDWLDEFERVQLILRTSARLRKLHGD